MAEHGLGCYQGQHGAHRDLERAVGVPEAAPPLCVPRVRSEIAASEGAKRSDQASIPTGDPGGSGDAGGCSRISKPEP